MHRNSSIHPKRVVLAVLVLLSLAWAPSSSEAVTRYQQTNLVSDVPGLAAVTDANLKNPWGISSSPTSPFWVSNNATGVATLYNSSGTPQSLVVTIPPSSSRPTGQVFNGSSNFLLTPGNPARFLFATENGTISGWNPGANPTIAILEVDNSASGAIYKGLAIGNNGSGDFLYAANFNGSIDVFDSNFAPATLSESFADPNLPSGYAPFNIQKIGDELYVTYAVSNGAGDDVPGPGNGIVSVFDLKGNLARRLTTGGVLNSPWGLALAPSSFGTFADDLLVGNHGDGLINAFDPTTGASLGTLADKNGTPIFNEGLWSLIFGNGGNGGDVDKLYFTAGPSTDPNGENRSLFGSLAPVPLPGTFLFLGSGLLGILAASRKRYQ